MERAVSRSELRRSRHEREQAAMREAGVDPSAASALGHNEEHHKSGGIFATTVVGVRNSRRRREQAAAAELGVDAPADFLEYESFARTSSNTSQASIRRSRLRREHAAIEKLEKERRQREREDLARERAIERAHAKAKREYLKKSRQLEGLSGNPASIWRRLACWCSRPHGDRTGDDEEVSEPLKQELYDIKQQL